MESHILNSYHQARYRTIGHKIMRAKSDSLSSEGSTQNSPEYAQIALQRVPSVAQSEDSNGEEWCQSQTINTTQSNQDTSSDEESSDGQDETEENLVIKEDKTDDEEDVDDNLVVQEIDIDDSDENIDVDDDSVQEVNIPVRQNGFNNARDSNLEDNSLVEGHDYDVITVYEVNPDLDLIEASSDDDSSQTDFAVTEKDENYDEGEYLNAEDSINYNNSTSYGSQPAPDNGVDLNVDAPVVLNVDEYFIEEKGILHVDGPVVKDVDEYFIKDKGKKKGGLTSVPNLDDFFIKHKLPEEESTKFHIPEILPNVDEFMVIGNNIKKEEKTMVVNEKVIPEEEDFFIKHKLPEEESTKFHIPETLPNVDEFLVIGNNIKKEEPTMVVTEKVIPEEDIQQKVVPGVEPENKLDVSINESDLEVLPNLEDLKRYLLEEMTYSKFKSIQKSCSLPHSPLHRPSVCMDIDDAKTCLSFEDLNLDLSDLTFESDKDKSESANKSDDILRTLTDEDVNSFLITNKPKANTEKDEDDLSPQEMEIEDTIESNITDVPPVDDSFRKLTSTPLPSIIPTSKVLDFCVEKTPSPSRKVLNRREKVASLDSQATPRKVVVPRKAKIVPLNPKFNSAKVIDVKPVVPVVKPVIVKPIPVVAKPAIPVVKAVVPKSIATKSIIAESKVVPVDLDDFVDVESCNDTVIPVLEANNLSSLLEQFEATEKLNKSKKPLRIVPVEEQKKLNKSLTNGVRIQDAGVQLKNNKMRQILMPTTIKTAVRRTPSPVHSDHDYCSSKKRHSLPNLKGGQSLLKPEVLSSNSRILSSRHRTCKNKKVVYNLSSDEESDKKDTKNKKVTSDSESKKKISITVKPPAQSNCRKKLSPSHSVNDVVLKSNSSVINKCASKASDTPCSQNSNGSIRLTIKNKSEVILNCDHKDSQIKHNVSVEKLKISSSVSNVPNVVNEIKQEKHIKMEEKHVKVEEKHVKEQEKHIKEVEKNIKEVVRIKNKNVHSIEADIVRLKEETRQKDENFYTALFSNKHDVKIPQTVPIKKEINAFEEELNKANDIKKEEPLKKKKLNLQEYKLRRGVSSNNSSTAVSPESIFPDMPQPLNSDKTAKPLILTLPNDLINKVNIETPKKFYDPIREASRKIVANAKKQKAEALRKRDEDIVMSKIPKVDNLQLQPLISDAEMLKIVGMTQPEPEPAPAMERPVDYDEIILVSVGTNTDDKLFKKLLEADLKMIEKFKRNTENALTPPNDPKSRINFKINKSENVLKQNVFDLKKDKRHEDKKHTETKIDKERFKDITATLKSVGKQVVTKMSSNSLFASIQDVVMKKAPEDEEPEKDRRQKPKSPVEKCEIFKFGKATIVREYDMKADHGEDKIILHLGKQRNKPISASITIQTEPVSEDTEVSKAKTIAKEKSSVNRRRNDSDMSMSSEGSPVRVKDKSKENKVEKPKADTRPEKRSLSKEKRSRSKDLFEAKYRRRSRSLSRSRRRRRSPTRSRSRSRGRFRRYRRSDRSDSPYKRKRRSRSRTYHKRRSTPRRSPSIKRNRSRSRSRPRSKSPVAKKAKPSPQSVEKKPIKSMTPPLRKPTVSESSDSSTSSSSSSSTSSSSSSSSASSGKSRSCSLYKQEPLKKGCRSFSSEDRENNTPVEERRIVFVGKLEKDITKSSLRSQFTKFGHVIEVRLHSKEDGTRYGFVTYQRPRDAWSAVEAASTFPQYDVGFGGRRAFCRQSYADLDGLEAKFTESAFHGSSAPPPVRRTDDMSFEQMLLEMKKKLSQRKNDPKRDEDP